MCLPYFDLIPGTWKLRFEAYQVSWCERISDTFWPFYDNSRLFKKISEDYRRVPNTNEELRGLPKTSKDYRRCSSHNRRFPRENLEIFQTNQKWKILQSLHRIFAGNSKIINLVNLTANTKNYGQITLNTKPHSDPLLRQFRLFQKISEDCWGFAKANRRFPRTTDDFRGEIRNFFNQKKKQNRTNLKTKNPPSN